MKKRWLAFAAACVMAFSLAGCVGGNAGTDNGEEAQEMHPWNGTAYGPYVLSAAEFPVQAPYPNEEDFFDENGTWRDKDYNDAYDAWAADQLNVTLTEDEAAAVPEFFARTAQVFLPEEEENFVIDTSCRTGTERWIGKNDIDEFLRLLLQRVFT